MSDCLEIAANVALFVSALLLLIDVAPHDFLPAHKKRVHAVNLLRKSRNVLGNLPPNTKVTSETTGMDLLCEPEAYSALSNFIRQKSPLAHAVDWAKAVGVGYATMSLPVGNSTVEAYRTLYVTLIPEEPDTKMVLVPVGQLGDLDAWLSEQRQGAITRIALVFLMLGFALQLAASLV